MPLGAAKPPNGFEVFGAKALGTLPAVGDATATSAAAGGASQQHQQLLVPRGRRAWRAGMVLRFATPAGASPRSRGPYSPNGGQR